MISRTSTPQPTGYPTLRSALGGGVIPVPRGAAVPIEPRMAGVRKTLEAPKMEPPVDSPLAQNESVSGGAVCFQCPSCSSWLRIEDPMTYTGLPSECPTCQVAIIGPRLA